MRRLAAFDRQWAASRTVIAALLATGAIAAPIVAQATGFNGMPTVASGGATFSTSGSVQTIQLNQTQTIINWAPTDAATSAAPIAFLDAGQTVSYTPQGVDLTYTVLNRILPSDATRAIGINGTINSAKNIRTWFYTPGGFLLGSNAVFNVGGLLLSVADIATTTNPSTGTVSFVTQTGAADQFSVAGIAGSQSAITIRAGAQINVATAGRSAYMVAIAPQISNAGTINVAGSTALVAAESASFAVDPAGLFTVTVSAGSTVSNNTLVNTGSVGSNDAAANGAADARRVYMVAVPKNNAVTMAISSGGTIGFAAAGAAAMDGNEIVLSAGANIADNGTGNPIGTTPAGSGGASLAIGGGTYSANLYAGSTGSLTVTDQVSNIGFLSDLTLVAPQATVNAATGTISVAGNLSLMADNTQQGTSGAGHNGLVTVGSGAKLDIGTSATLLGVNGDLLINASDTLGGTGGTAKIGVTGGMLNVAGSAQLTAAGSWANATRNPGLITTTGGTATATASAGGKMTVGGLLSFDASADGTNADAVYAKTSPQAGADYGYNANGGSAGISVTGAGSNVLATGGLAASASAAAATNLAGAPGGYASGGTVLIKADSGGTLQFGAASQLLASATATGGQGSSAALFASGGAAVGGTVRVIANDGTVAMQGPGAISLIATARGGNGSGGGAEFGGAATGGTALIETQGVSGRFVANMSGATTGGQGTLLDVSALGGLSSDLGGGGAANGGTATISVTGAGQSIAFNGTPTVSLQSGALGGSGNGRGGGAATGGTTSLSVTGGSFVTVAQAQFDASATGGADSSGAAGAATGGNVLIGIKTGGTAQTQGGAAFSAFAAGGVGGKAGGAALGGNVLIEAVNPGVFDFGASTGGITFDTSYTGGTGASVGAAASAGGARLRTTGPLTLGGALTIIGNTSLLVEAGGAIGVTGTIVGTDAGASAQLWADNTGTGIGTATLANNAINLSGAGARVDIDYNPTALGTPTNYAPGVAAGLLTSYQLVDNVAQLQLIGGFLSQNFALGHNIDASATQGWNGGTGFVPIGSQSAPFLGNFDGLGHTITSLFITPSGPATDYTGLFGAVGMISGTGQLFRNVGLVNPQIYANGGVVGGLIGGILNDAIIVTDSYVTGGTISGSVSVGGLIGDIGGAGTGLFNVHSDTAVVVTTTGGQAGGLVGNFSVGNITINQAFATGSVTATAPNASNIGGLIGAMRGVSTVSQAYAAGPVSAAASSANVGGLIGFVGAGSTVSQAYATGAVTAGTGSASVGGLAGLNAGTISDSWASAPVSAPVGTNIGGLVGWNEGGTINNAYWDHFSTGQVNGVGTDTSSTTTLNFVTSDPAEILVGGPSAWQQASYGNLNARNWLYDQARTRPLGNWEVPLPHYLVAPVSSAHQVQLIDQNLAASYLIIQNIDMAGTARQSEIWQTPGFMPITNGLFTGTIAGSGHVLSNLTFDPTNELVGLIGLNAGLITDLGLWNATINSAYDVVAEAGLIAVQNMAGGTIIDSFATGTINAANATVGGLVAINSGTISQSYASVTISAAQQAGALVGSNFGSVSGVFANGSVTATTAGGLIGFNSAPAGSITNAYWDSQLSGVAIGCGLSSTDCTGPIGLTTTQTRQAGSFTGFSIDSTGGQTLPWRIYEGSTTPLLKAFLQSITVQPQSLTQVYNAAVPVLDATTYGADTALLFGTAQLGGLTKNAGTSAITYQGGLYSNQIGYDLVASSSPGVLKITPAALILSAISQARSYDATLASTGTATVSGLFSGDTISGLTQSYDSPNAGSRTLAINAGYVINDGNAGGNYIATLQSAPGSITAAPLTLTYAADAATSVYGNAVAGLTGSYAAQGLQGQDTAKNVLGGTTAFATAANSQSNVGKYTVTGSGLSLIGNNYVLSIIQQGGNATALSITARPITVTAQPVSRTFSQVNLPLIYIVTGAGGAAGLVNGDQLTGTLATSATPASPAGAYAITQGTLTASSNYQLTYVSSALTVSVSRDGIDFTVVSVDSSIPGSSGIDGGGGIDARKRRQLRDSGIAAMRGALLPAWVPGTVFDDHKVTRPRPVNEPVSINGDAGLWSPIQ